MSDRYTEKDAAISASRLAGVLGKEFGACWKKDKSGKLKAKVGCWDIDYSPTWGGIVINEKVNESGGESTPLGTTRKTPREFVESVNFTIKAIEIYKNKKK